MPEKGKNGKKKAHLFGFFSLLYPLCIFFCILNLKIHIKKGKNAKKKQKKIFKLQKYICKKKAENNISKKHAKKKQKCKKKAAKKAGAVYFQKCLF